MVKPLTKEEKAVVENYTSIACFLVIILGRTIKNGLNIDGKLSEEAVINTRTAAERIGKEVSSMLK